MKCAIEARSFRLEPPATGYDVTPGSDTELEWTKVLAPGGFGGFALVTIRVVASFRNAFAGLAALVATQRNARIHLLASVLVIASGLALGVSRIEWCWLVVAMVLVWSAEAFNTAIELLGDAVSGGDHHPRIGKAKDLSAAAVLVAAMGAAAIGVMIFLPHVLE